MPAKFCVQQCGRVAVKAPRSTGHCRECYNRLILPTVELMWLEVTADQVRVTDARTQQSHGKGSVVALDPVETNVAALVASGIGRVVPAPDSKPSKGTTAKG